MTWFYGLTMLAATIAGLRWLLGRGDDVHEDMREIRGSRPGGREVPDAAYVPDGVDVNRPGH